MGACLSGKARRTFVVRLASILVAVCWVLAANKYALGDEANTAKTELEDPTQLYEATIFTTSNSEIPDDLVECLVADEEGRIWVGTSRGLSVFDGESWENKTPGILAAAKSPEAERRRRETAAVLKIGNAWFKLLGESVEGAPTIQEALAGVDSMVRDPMGNIYVYCPVGLFKWDGGRWQEITGVNEITEGFISAMAVYSEQELIVGTSRGGLAILGPNGFEIIHEEPSPKQALSNPDIVLPRDIACDGEGTLWFTDTRNRKLRTYGGKDWQVFNDYPRTIRHLLYAALYFDKTTGSLFIGVGSSGGTAKGKPGLVQIKGEDCIEYFPDLAPTDWDLPQVTEPVDEMQKKGIAALGVIFKYVESKHKDFHLVRCIFVDSSSRIWLGTSNGLAFVEGNAYKSFPLELSGERYAGFVETIAEDTDRNIWVGTTLDGLFVLKRSDAKSPSDEKEDDVSAKE